MRTTMQLVAALIATGLFLLGGTAQAAQIVDFQLDSVGSSVDLDTGLGPPGLSASIAFSDSGFSLGEGGTAEFDFIEWTPIFAAVNLDFTVDATLAFSEPVAATTTSTGEGSVLVFGGRIRSGVLEWNEVPRTVTFSDGTVIAVDFQDGINLGSGPVTTTASVTVLSAGGSAPIPEPGSAGLFAIGGFLVATRLRRKPW